MRVRAYLRSATLALPALGALGPFSLAIWGLSESIDMAKVTIEQGAGVIEEQTHASADNRDHYGACVNEKGEMAYLLKGESRLDKPIFSRTAYFDSLGAGTHAVNISMPDLGLSVSPTWFPFRTCD
jgi:hypothetical protein